MTAVPSPYIVFSKNVSDKNNSTFGVDRFPQSQGVNVVSYAQGAYKFLFYGRGGHVNFGRGSFDLKCIALLKSQT